MILSTHQPYFAPYPGFFYKAYLSDIFVLMDHVQFPQGTTWTTRNRFKNDQGTLWMTIPVLKKGLGLQRIDEVKICPAGRWARKHSASLQHAYSNAPYFAEHLGFVKELFSNRFHKLIDLNLEIIRYLMRYLAIDTKVVLLSELGFQETGTRLLIEICKRLGTSTYLAQSSAGKYLDAALFHSAGVQLRFFKPPALIYPQLWGDFIYELSAFDLLFNCGPKAREILKAA